MNHRAALDFLHTICVPRRRCGKTVLRFLTSYRAELSRRDDREQGLLSDFAESSFNRVLERGLELRWVIWVTRRLAKLPLDFPQLPIEFVILFACDLCGHDDSPMKIARAEWRERSSLSAVESKFFCFELYAYRM